MSDPGYQFTNNRFQSLVVYADGSCRNNGRPNACAGIGLYWGENSALNHSERLPTPEQSNNRAELYALIRAIELCPYPRMRLEIRSDSRYAIGCECVKCEPTLMGQGVTKWLDKWRSNGWINAKGYTVSNADLIKHLARLLDRRQARVRFVHVDGHAGHKGNEMADALARVGSDDKLYCYRDVSEASTTDSDDSGTEYAYFYL